MLRLAKSVLKIVNPFPGVNSPAVVFSNVLSSTIPTNTPSELIVESNSIGASSCALVIPE